MKQVESSYLGGPRRDESPQTGHAPMSSEERVERKVAHQRQRRERRRRTATAAVIGVALIAAGTLGYVLGNQVRRDGAEGTSAGREDLTTEEFLSSEMNRLMLELWEMESLERR